MAGTRYHHGYKQFEQEVLCGAAMTAHLEEIASEAGRVAVATAPELTGEFKNSFVVGTAVENHEGLRAVGFLTTTDPDGLAKEFANPDDAQNRTMNKAMRKAVG